jgi:pimeloyl-ACP methyl ester carboxylesterase
MRQAAAAFVMLLGLCACGGEAAPPAPEAVSPYVDHWFTFSDPVIAERFRGVNLYETERQKSGRLVLADGSAVALRLVTPAPGDDLAFIAPALGLSFVAKVAGENGWTVKLSDPEHGDAAATLLPAVSVPAETVGQIAILPDGRRMHMVCAGEGAPVVILDYGAGGTMKKDWGELAATIAGEAKTRVCAYDRAGRGLSDPASTPRNAAAVASDIEQMLTAANIPTPVVLVGHSLGSYHVRQFANSYANKTAGLVLVDPSGDGQMERFNAAIPKIQQIQDEMFSAQAKLNCIATLVARPVPPDDPFAQQCGGNDPDALSATRSEVEEMPLASTQSLIATRRSYGDMPLIVLTRGDYDQGMPPDFTAEDKQAMRSVWETMHAEMAALSTRGDHRFIPNAGHYIQRDAPGAVVAAVTDVVASVRAAPE